MTHHHLVETALMHGPDMIEAVARLYELQTRNSQEFLTACKGLRVNGAFVTRYEEDGSLTCWRVRNGRVVDVTHIRLQDLLEQVFGH